MNNPAMLQDIVRELQRAKNTRNRRKIKTTKSYMIQNNFSESEIKFIFDQYNIPDE